MNVFMLKLYEDVTSKVTIDLLGKFARLNHDFLLFGSPLILLGTIHILRNHIFRILDPPPPYVSMFLVLKIIKNWLFLTPLPPTSDYVIYEWSLIQYRQVL